MNKHGIPRDESITLFKGYSPGAGELMMQIILERTPDIEAVFCVNNLVFLGAMKLVQQEESRTKRPIMMAAFDIRHYCDIFKRPLVCANQDLQKIAESVVSLLIDRIRGNPRKDNQMIMPIQVERHRI
jgi:DNA-binding LacI/PurR family transcriptional regulator